LIPARGERTDLINNVTPAPGREEVLQIALNGGPTYRVSGVFFDRTSVLNEERSQRALCYTDDSDAETTPLPSIDKRKNVKPSLADSVLKKLPLPGVFATETNTSRALFTTATYRSKHHRVSDIVDASLVPNLVLDTSIKARATQYSENKTTVQAALARETPQKRPSKCGHCHTTESEYQSTILYAWELTRDIERLEALARNIATARKMAAETPLLRSYLTRRVERRSIVPPSRLRMEDGMLVDEHGIRVDERGRLVDRNDNVVEGGEEVEEEGSVDTLINAVPPVGTGLRHSYEFLAGTVASVPPSTTGEPEQSRPPSAHSSHATGAESQNRYRMNARTVMSRLGPVRRSIRRSNTVSTRGSAGNRSANSERSQRGVRRYRLNTGWPGDGQWAKFRT
jgi:hypothetical protein